MRPPCSTTPIVWAAASWREARRASQRNGCRTGSIVPRSGQVPTTTSAPAVRSRRTADARQRTERVGGMRWVTSFAPTMITQMSGTGSGSASTRATWRSRSSERAPGVATVRNSTGHSASAASPDASSAPGVCPDRCTPWPAAVESPSIVSRSGASPGSAYARPYSPSAFGT
ncbi:hypothetical protein SPURM210S_04855 [Streptomyces purpurascens]